MFQKIRKENINIRNRKLAYLYQGIFSSNHEEVNTCTDDELWNCIPETCILLLTSVTPINFNKKKGERAASEVT